jgi:hypothetical protein
MTLIQLIRIASNAYAKRPLGRPLLTYCDRDGKLLPLEQHGDPLGQFIVTELVETFSEGFPAVNQLNDAISVLEEAVEDLNSIIDALQVVAQAVAQASKTARKKRGKSSN